MDKVIFQTFTKNTIFVNGVNSQNAPIGVVGVKRQMDSDNLWKSAYLATDITSQLKVVNNHLTTGYRRMRTVDFLHR